MRCVSSQPRACSVFGNCVLVVSLIPFLRRASPPSPRPPPPHPQILESLLVKRGGHTLGVVSCPSGLSHQEAPAGPASVCMASSVLWPYRRAPGQFFTWSNRSTKYLLFQNLIFSVKCVGKSLPLPIPNSSFFFFTCFCFFPPCIWRTKELAQTHSDVKEN